MRIIFGLLLIGLAIVWGAFWSAAAGTTSETGIWNSTTWTVMAVAGLGLLPLAGGLYLIGRALADLLRPRSGGLGSG